MESLNVFSDQNLNHTETIQSIAVKLIKEQKKQNQFENETKEHTIFFLGSATVGKSTIINRFFDREENLRPTLALEYSFGRRSTQMNNLQKQILNIWELGCLDNSTELIEIPIRIHNLENFSAIILLNLAKPERLLSDLERSLESLKKGFQKYVKECDIEYFKEKSITRMKNCSVDEKIQELFPLPVIIVGGKYDIFQNFDPEVKKHICRFLRSVSHSIGAALMFYSHKHGNLVKTIRDTINHLGFGSPSNPFRSTLYDYNEPLLIWFGMDSWEKINITPSSYNTIMNIFRTQIKQIDNELSSLPEDPVKDLGFKEAAIDELVSQKNDELLSFVGNTEIRAKFESIKETNFCDF